MNNIIKFELSAPANSRLFRELGGIWLEISAVMARQIFNDTNIELCVYDGESEFVLQSKEDLETAIANNSMLVIFLGETVAQPNDTNIRWDDALADILDTGVIILKKDDGKYHLCRTLDNYSFYSANTRNELILEYYNNDMEAYTYDD